MMIKKTTRKQKTCEIDVGKENEIAIEEERRREEEISDEDKSILSEKDSYAGQYEDDNYFGDDR